jgi:anaerobic selenocysteine-containing dehydrogenase
MAKIPLVISLSPIGDDTSMMADLILPATSHYEGPVDVVNPPTLPYPLFGAGESVMYEKPFDTLPVGDIIIELAGAIGPAVRDNIPFQSHQDMVETSMTGLFESGRGVVIDAESEKPPTWFGKEPADRGYRSKRSFFKAMGQGLFWYDPAFRFGRLDGVFETPSGKFEFVSQTLTDALKPFIDRHGRQAALVELGYPGAPDSLNMPHLAAFPPRPTSKAFPLVAVPLHEFKMVTTFWGNAPYLTKLLDDTTLTDDDLGVMVNPQTAAAHHLHNGDKAHLRTEKGQQTVRVFTSDQARPGVVYAPIGLGHTGYAYYLRGKGVNPLEIIKAQTDPVSGQPFYNGVPAQLIKA